MARVLDTIWAWGERQGAARETGQYVPAANAAFEQSRRSALERIDYLRSGADFGERRMDLILLCL